MLRIIFPLLLLGLTGCTPTVSLEAAPLSNDPDCAEVMVRLPKEIGDFDQRYTNAQASSAWGEPTAIIFRCGLEPVEISPLPCVTAGEIDWLVDDSQNPSYRFVSFGTMPAVEVVVDSTKISGVSSLEAIAPTVKQLSQTAKCTEITN